MCDTYKPSKIIQKTYTNKDSYCSTYTQQTRNHRFWYFQITDQIIPLETYKFSLYKFVKKKCYKFISFNQKCLLGFILFLLPLLLLLLWISLTFDVAVAFSKWFVTHCKFFGLKTKNTFLINTFSLDQMVSSLRILFKRNKPIKARISAT